MNILQVPFKFLSIYGVWEPENLKTSIAKKLYKIYTTIISTSMHLLFISDTISLIKSSNMEEFNEVFFLNVTIFIVCCRIIYLLVNRNRIINLKNILHHEFCTPKNDKEFKIIDSFDYINRYT